MENERNKCRKCGGEGKPSKGYMNFHNIQTIDLSKEFKTKLLNCIKCTSCGHSWIPEKSTRELALEWWNSLKNHKLKQSLADDLTLTSGEKAYQSLTGREIEEIWKKETGGGLATGGDKVLQILNSKPNQKQFKKFNPELFKAYIDKFSDEDKMNALKVLFWSLSSENMFHVTEIGIGKL